MKDFIITQDNTVLTLMKEVKTARATSDTLLNNFAAICHNTMCNKV